MTREYRVTRNVPADEPGNYFGGDVDAGEVFPEFKGCTYGCCDVVSGVVLTGPNGSFFEFPRSAVEKVA